MFGNNYNNGANDNRSNNMNPNEFRNELNQYGRNQRAMKYMPGFLVLKIVSGAFRNIFVIIRDFWVTLLWIAVFWFGVNSDIPAFGGLVVVVGLAMMIAGFLGPQFGEKYEWMAQFQKYAPIIADVGRRGRVTAELKKREDAYSFMEHAGVLNRDRLMELQPDVLMVDHGETVEFIIRHGLPGIPTGSLVEKLKTYQSVLNAVRTVSENLSNGGARITFYRTDPLDEGVTVMKPGKLDVEKMKVECAVNAFGKKMSITFGDSSGMVVGGVPGSGKTAGITSFLLPLALSEFVNLSIIDGKGGSDWSAYEQVASTYISGDDDLEPIRDFMKAHYEMMVNRVKMQKQLLGQSNFWNVSAKQRLAAGLKFELLVIDECQGLFEGNGRTKEEKEMMAEILRYSSAMVKRGRSAGVFVIFITQKPTQDSLPTAIRDNSGLRLSFRLTTSSAEAAVLGAMPDTGGVVPHATAIPAARKGGAVLGTESGDFEEVRFFYIPENRQEELLAA